MEIWRRLTVAVLVLSASFGILAIEAGAQGLTGTIVGTVKDSHGLVVPGAVVRVASPALIGGEQQITSGTNGQFRFPSLPPGEYTVTVELAPKFSPTSREITVGGGQTREVPVILQPAGIAETIDVTASGDLSRSSGLETRRDSDYIRTIPTRRSSMFDFMRSTPGVSPSSPSSGTVNTVSVFGSAVNENGFLIDGTNFTCPCQGMSRAEPIVDVIQELHVQNLDRDVTLKLGIADPVDLAHASGTHRARNLEAAEPIAY